MYMLHNRINSYNGPDGQVIIITNIEKSGQELAKIEVVTFQNSRLRVVRKFVSCYIFMACGGHKLIVYIYKCHEL